ncbi:MAG: hypothetical protein ACEQSA_02250 [Weeksellaceae bacterium]
MYKVKQKEFTKFDCPFCKDTVKASGKTDIFYRSNWVKGCSACFILSINKISAAIFQQKEY